MKFTFNTFNSLVVLMSTVAHFQASAQTWRVTRSEWTERDEIEYSRFVQALGESGCGSRGSKSVGMEKSGFNDCIRSPRNPLRSAEDSQILLHVDCAKLPHALRAYFAMKKGLPFSYASGVSMAPGPNGERSSQNDPRYSEFGNRISDREDVLTGGNFVSLARSMMNEVYSANYRVHPQYESNTLPADMYSVDLRLATESDLRGIRPGTNLYDPNGHVAVVYKVEKDGRIRLFDAHPDNSISRIVYGEKFARSRPAAGAGFKNFRPLKVVNGKVVLAKNSEIADFSLTQFFGTNPDPKGWSKGKFILNGLELSYYDYVRTVMAGGNLKFEPEQELTNAMDALCQDVKDRIIAVEGNGGLNSQAHPAKLPSNIYGTSGDWESYSTPSRDARLKTSFKELFDNTARFLDLYARGSDRIDYQGTDLKADLRNAYIRAVTACKLSYKGRNGTVEFNLNDVIERMWLMSFDPYHSTELRWGCIGSDASACLNSSDAWYRAEQKLRNQIERTYDARMDYSAAELPNAPIGVVTPPEVDVRKLLR